MLHCGPAHHGAQAVQSNLNALPDASPAEHASHGHAIHHAPDPGAASDTRHDATSPDGTGIAKADKVTDPAKVAKATYQKCSACASCCAGLALPSTAVMPPTIDAAGVVALLSLPEAASVVIDGPERPPRILRV